MEIINDFRNYLLKKTISNPTTLKNYLSDLRHFVSWYEKSFGIPFEPRELEEGLIILYEGTSGASLSAGGIVNQAEKMSHASVKRRLSSLRQFARFAVENQYIEKNPFELITNHQSLITSLDIWHIAEFKDYLKFKKASELTVKNYVTDIHSFRRWYESAIEPHVGDTSFPVINDSIIEEYKNRLVEHKLSAPRTVNRKLSSIRKFVEFAILSNYTNRDFFYTPTGVENLEISKEQAQISATLSLNEIEEQKIKINYSPIPPIRLIQRLIIVPYVLAESAIAQRIITLFYGSKVLGLATKKINSSLPRIKIPQKVSDLLKIKGYEKSFYAPNEVSLDNYPFHKKLWYHIRFTRPNWYKKYHSLPVVHYIHFAILIVFCAGVGIALYRNLVTDQTPLFAAPLSPPRILSFQGRLTDNLDNPITAATDLRFAIYNDLSASGAALLWQEVHYETNLDQDGIFSVLLGTNTPIPDSVFFENDTIYLGVTIEQTAELAPRRRIASVPYAANSEALQGMLPITDGGAGQTNVVLALDSAGDLTIGGTASPTFTATGGQFALSGDVLLLSTETGTNSDVIISPAGLGTIELHKPLTNGSTTGNLTPGGVEINDKFGILATESAVAAFVLRNDGAGDLFTASTSSTTRFTIENDGSLIIPAYSTAGGIFYANGSGVINQTTAGGSGDCLQSAGGLTPTWGTCGSGSLWRIDQGAISPINDTLDLLIGSNASSSAKFAVLNVNSGTPVASISAISPTTALALSSNGSIQTVRNNTLTIGGNTTGNIVISPLNGAGRVGINTSTSLAALDLRGPDGTTTIASISGSTNQPALLVDNAAGAGNQIVASKSGETVFVVDNDGNVIVGAGGGGKLTAAVIDPYLVQNQYTTGNTQLTFQTMAASNGDFLYKNQSTTLATLVQAGQLQLAITGSSGGLSIGADTQLFRGDTNRLDLATGDSLNVVSGNYQVGGVTIIDSSSNATFNDITVNGACTGCSSGTGGVFQELAGAIVPNNSTLDFLIGGQATTSAKFAVLNVNNGTPVASVSSGLNGNSIYMTADGTLATQRRQTLTIGNSSTYDTTGNVLINSNGTGNVGIGTTNPGVKLDVTGAITASTDITATGGKFATVASGQTVGLQLDGYVDAGSFNNYILNNSPTAGTYATLNFGRLTGTLFGFIRSNNNTQAMEIGTAATTRLTVSSGGNVGIGTASPISELHVTRPLTFGATGKALVIFDQIEAQDILAASSSGTTRLTIDNTGNLQLFGQADLRFADADSSNYVAFQAPTTVGTNVTWTLPDADASGCFQSNGAGTLSISTCGSGGGSLWEITLGLIHPINATLDLAIGGTASSSSKFLFANVNSGTPTLKIFNEAMTQSLNLSHDGTSGNIVSSTNTINIGSGGGSLFLETDIKNDTANFDGAIKVSDKLLVTNSESAGTALAVFNNLGAGDIFTASNSGTPRFSITSAGGIKLGTSEGTGGECLKSGGAGLASSWGACASQTPWTSDIDADGFDLTDLSNIEFRTTTGAPAGSIVAGYSDNTGDLTFNVLTGKTFNLAVNGTDEYNFSAAALEMNGNNITGVGNITAAAGLAISTTTAGVLSLDSGTTGAINIGTGANAKTLTIGNTTTTTALNFDTGTGGINFGDNANTKTIDIGGVTNSGTDTINIATEGTLADVISIGNANAATTVAITGGTAWSVTTGGVLNVASCTGCGGVTGTNSPFQQGAGIIFPNNSTVDFLIGGQATASAKFAVLNVDSGTPTASVSATAVTDRPGLYMTGTGTLSSVNKGTLTIGSSNTGNIVIGTDATDRIITLGNITGATALNLNSGTGGIALASTSTGDITLNSADTLLLDSAGVLELNSSAGVISIGNDAVAQAINLGTGAAARTITLGNITGTTAVNLNTGTGGSTITTTGAGDFTVASGDDVIINGAGANAAIDIGTAAVAHTIGIGNVTGATALTLNSGTGAINIGTSIAKTITIGNATTTTALNFDTGTGGINFGDNANTKTIDIGGVTNSGTDTINIATEGTLADVISIGNANAATTVAITGGNDWSITAGGALTVASCTGCSSGTGGVFQELAGAIVPNNSTLDFLIGGQATTSAKFAVLNVDSGTPTASVSATAVADRPGLYMTGTGTLSSVNKGTLTIGSSNTGNIVIGTDATARIVTIGNSNTTTALNLKTGTGGLTISTAGTERVVVDSNGRLQIGTSTAPANLDLNPFVRIYNSASHTDPAASISAQTTSAALVITNDGSGDLIAASVSGSIKFAVRNNGDILFTGTIFGPDADFAEYFLKQNPSESFEAGTLVCQSENSGVTKCNSNNPNHKLLGAISDSPLITGGGDRKNDPNYVLVGLIGQLKVRVGGDIKVGDPLTISPQTGVAVKATNEAVIIGYAMESNNNGAKPRVASSIQKSYYNPNLALNYSGDDEQTFIANLHINEANGTWRLTDAFGNVVNRASAFSNLVAANIKAGFINAQKITTNAFNASTASIANLTANVINGTSATIANISTTSLNASSAVLGSVSIGSENVLIAGVSLRDYIAQIVQETVSNGVFTNGNEIISPIASIDKINTNIISPLADGASIEIEVKPENITINNTDTGDKVVDIDNEGNATFSGTLSSETLETNNASISGNLATDTLQTNDATISGTLSADRIIANTIDGLDDRISSVASSLIASNQSQTTQSASSSSITNHQSLITADEIDAGNIYADFGIYSQGLSVLGSITTAQLTAMDSISIGTGFILTDNSINTLGATLEIQPLRQGDISFMAGRVKIDTDGNVDINGNLNLAGIVNASEGVFNGIRTNSLATNIISPLPDSDLVIKLGNNNGASTSGSLKIANANGDEVLKISGEGNIVASGSATFDKLNFNLVGEALADSDLTATATGSAGFANVQRNKPEVTIYNERITKDSLIYITPFGDTQNKVLHLLRQVPQSETADGSFTVGISGTPAIIDIQFNWLIVN